MADKPIDELKRVVDTIPINVLAPGEKKRNDNQIGARDRKRLLEAAPEYGPRLDAIDRWREAIAEYMVPFGRSTPSTTLGDVLADELRRAGLLPGGDAVHARELALARFRGAVGEVISVLRTYRGTDADSTTAELLIADLMNRVNQFIQRGNREALAEVAELEAQRDAEFPEPTR